MNIELARGVRDIPPNEKLLRDEIVDFLRGAFELHGFMSLETPILERMETFESKYAGGEEILKEIFQLTDQGQRRLGLRFDLTVPLARYVAMNPQLKMPFKRYHIGDVFRDGPIKAGRTRQFIQCDADIVGAGTRFADVEVLSLLQFVFNQLEIDVVIKLNSIKLLHGMIDAAGIEVSQRESVILTLDKLEKVGKDGVRNELLEKKIDTQKIDLLLNIVTVRGDNDKILDQLESRVSDTGKEGIKELREILSLLPEGSYTIVPTLARGLAYYTGIIVEAFAKSGPVTSSLAAGGRYDTMIGNFIGGREVPAVGVSFGLEPISLILKEKMGKISLSPALVHIVPIGVQKEALELAQELRSHDIAADVDLLGRNPSKNLEYAQALGIPFVILLGKQELSKGIVKVRDMSTGEEKDFNQDDLLEFLNECCNEEE